MLLHEKTTMLRPMKRCKQRTNLWLGHSILRIRFWLAWKATIAFRPQDRQKKAAGHIHLPGSFVVRAAREDRNVEVKGKVNENFSRVSPILRLRPFLRNFLTTSIRSWCFTLAKSVPAIFSSLCRVRVFVLDFVPGVFRPQFGIWPFYFCGVVKGFFLVCWGLWRARADVAMEAVDSVVTPIKEFAKDSVRLVNRCHKPDRKGMFRWTDPQPWTQCPSWSHIHFTSVLLCNRLYNADQTLRRLASELRWSPEA